MEPIYVSPSRLRVFRDCPWSYYCKYVLKLPDEGGHKTHLGSLIHEIFENLSTPSKSDRRKKYVLYSIKGGTIHNVILRFYAKMLKKYKIPDDLHDLGRKLILDAFRTGFDIKNKIIGVEKEFSIRVADDVFIKGFIDLVVELSTDTIELTDYKSGVPYNEEKCQDEYQPFFYKIAAKILYPGYKNYLFNFHFLKNRKTITVDKTEQELSDFLKEIIVEGRKMLQISKENAITKRTWKCKNMCAFKHPNKEMNYMGCREFYDKNGKSRW